MKSTPLEPTGPPTFHREHEAKPGTERFMLTLCQLATAVSIRPPRAPQLKPYSFFMSRTYQPGGNERLYLHMGYFRTLVEAERWAETVRPHYPNALAHVAPAVFLQATEPEAASLASGSFHRVAARGGDSAPVEGETLSDTAVMKILEARRGPASENVMDDGGRDEIALLRPEDTGVREVLKETVAQGGAVSFAVQLHWSTQPIDLGSVRPLAVFKLHTLYSTETFRRGHARYFLRLGFFADPMSAKQIAVEVLPAFPSAAVVPVVEPEISRARQAAVEGSAIPRLVERPADEDPDPGEMPWSTTVASVADEATRAAPGNAGTIVRLRRRTGAGRTALEPDPLSESGVRHLKVEIQEEMSGRWRIVRLEGAVLDGEQSTA